MPAICVIQHLDFKKEETREWMSLENRRLDSTKPKPNKEKIFSLIRSFTYLVALSPLLLSACLSALFFPCPISPVIIFMAFSFFNSIFT